MEDSEIQPIAKKGFAPIKKEYLKVNHKPCFDPTHVPKVIAEEIIETISSEKLANNTVEDEKLPSKKKLRGKNKNRPTEKRLCDNDKLCPSIVGGRTCPFGNGCKFSHDIESFLKNNPDELKGSCYCFETYGYCSYGVTCMYRSQHTNIYHKNLINKDLFDPDKSQKRTLNCVTKDLQIRLRKREYSFTRANEVARFLNKKHKVDDTLCATTTLDAGAQCENMKSPLNIAEDMNNENKLLSTVHTVGCLTDEDCIKLKNLEKKRVDFHGKLYLAPLTTVGNLPFRRICKKLGVDVTCGEMAVPSNLLQGQASEWALLKRHFSEDIFGVQLCGSSPDCVSRAAQVISEVVDVDFIDINIGCPIDLVVKRGDGCALMGRTGKLENLIKSVTAVVDIPITLKMRTGLYDGKNVAHVLMPKVKDWNLSLVTIHGRSREQRYTKLADWQYIKTCADIVKPTPIFGNGDILSQEDYYHCLNNYNVDGALIARGALVKPWIFTEIKEKKTWDISASERLDIYKDFVNYGLEHWGSDKQGVANTRKFLLEWLSFTYRYIPVGILERLPQKINEKPFPYYGRNDLETLLSSPNCADWIKISEMLLGPVPNGFSFLPKHKANSFQ